MEDVNWNEKSHIKMLKWHYSTVQGDGGRGICPHFSSSPKGTWQLKVPTHGNMPSKAKKNANVRGSAGGGGGGRCAQVELELRSGNKG